MGMSQKFPLFQQNKMAKERYGTSSSSSRATVAPADDSRRPGKSSLAMRGKVSVVSNSGSPKEGPMSYSEDSLPSMTSRMISLAEAQNSANGTSMVTSPLSTFSTASAFASTTVLCTSPTILTSSPSAMLPAHNLAVGSSVIYNPAGLFGGYLNLLPAALLPAVSQYSSFISQQNQQQPGTIPLDNDLQSYQLTTNSPEPSEEKCQIQKKALKRGRPQQPEESESDSDPTVAKKRNRRHYARDYRAKLRQKLDIVDELKAKLKTMQAQHAADIQRLQAVQRDQLDRMRESYMIELNKKDEVMAMVLKRNM